MENLIQRMFRRLSPYRPIAFHALAVAQGEETCKNYYSTRGMESIVVRIDHLYGTPVKGKMQTDPCFQMTLEMLKSGKIAANGRNLFSMIHQNDAIEFIYLHRSG